MNAIVERLDAIFSEIPLPLLEVWGRFGYIIGLALMIAAFGGFVFRPGGRWGLGREQQAWDAKALLAGALTCILIIVTGYIGSFIVLVPGAQTFESLKDLSVFLCILLFGYPALIAVPFAYGVSDVIEGVPPNFLLDWWVGYFINPACFWVAYQFIGKNPDFRRARTWAWYLGFVVIFMGLEPQLWGYICSGKFSPEISYRNITPALFFTTAVTWIIAPFAMLGALPLARKYGLYWADIPGHVKERLLGRKEWIWESGRSRTPPVREVAEQGLPIRMFLAAPFIALVLGLVGSVAYLTLRSGEDTANKLASRLHQEISENINLQLDDHLAKPENNDPVRRAAVIAAVLRSGSIAKHGRAFLIDRSGRLIASSQLESPAASRGASPPADASNDPVVGQATRSLEQVAGGLRALKAAAQFRFDIVTAKPLSRETWLAQATPYQDNSGQVDWIEVTAMPAGYYLEGVRAGSSQSAMVLAVALVLSLLVAILLSSAVTRKIRTISSSVHAMAQGDLAQRVVPSRLEELDDLSRSFNHMAGQLEASMKSLEAEVEKQRRMSDALGMVSERLQLATRAANIGIWDWDVAKDELIWDDAMYRLYGISKETFSGAYDAWEKSLHPKDLEVTTAKFQAALHNQGEFAPEFRIVWPDGSEHVIQAASRTLRDERGQPLRMIGINYDVTEHRRKEMDLQKFKDLVDSTEDSIISKKLDGTIESWNHGAEHMFGFTASEMVGQPLNLLLPPDRRAEEAEFLSRIAQGRKVDYYETVRRGKDGRQIDISATIAPIRDTEGRVVGASEIARDITARKAAEAARARLAAIVDYSSDAIVSETLDGLILTWNGGAEKMFGYTAEEMIGRPNTRLIPEGAAAGETGAANRLQKGEITEYYETMRLHRDGRLVNVSLTRSPIYDESGAVTGVSKIARDITEHKKLEERFLRAQRVEAIGTLASGVAHDLNNLLTPMLMVRALLKESMTDARDHALLDMMHQAARRGAGIVKQLLTYSRGVKEEKQVLQLHHLFKEMLNMIQETFPRDIIVQQNVPRNLWPILASPTQIHQVLMNLCVNARDAMPQGGRLSLVAQNVQLSAAEARVNPKAQAGPYIIIAVADTGTGISPENLVRIFDPFFTTKEVAHGTGLGLSTVAGIVDSHRGFITAYSELGKGSSFNVYLPAEPVAARPLPERETSRLFGGAGQTILVVDDEAPIVTAMCHLLQKHNYRTVSAASGDAGLLKFEQNRPAISLVLTDTMMPMMSGPTMVRALRKHAPDLAIIAMSGLDQESKRMEYAALGVTEVLLKPCDPAIVLEAIHRHLNPAK